MGHVQCTCRNCIFFFKNGVGKIRFIFKRDYFYFNIFFPFAFCQNNIYCKMFNRDGQHFEIRLCLTIIQNHNQNNLLEITILSQKKIKIQLKLKITIKMKINSKISCLNVCQFRENAKTMCKNFNISTMNIIVEPRFFTDKICSSFAASFCVELKHFQIVFKKEKKYPKIKHAKLYIEQRRILHSAICF